MGSTPSNPAQRPTQVHAQTKMLQCAKGYAVKGSRRTAGINNLEWNVGQSRGQSSATLHELQNYWSPTRAATARQISIGSRKRSRVASKPTSVRANPLTDDGSDPTN